MPHFCESYLQAHQSGFAVALISLIFANRDTDALGVNENSRKGYIFLRNYIEALETSDHKMFMGLGVIDVHRDFIEPPELIRDRILISNMEMLIAITSFRNVFGKRK